MLCDKENPQNAPELTHPKDTSIIGGRRRSSRLIEKENAEVLKNCLEVLKKIVAAKKEADRKAALVTFAVPEGVHTVTDDLPDITSGNTVLPDGVHNVTHDDLPNIIRGNTVYPIARLLSGHDVGGGDDVLGVRVIKRVILPSSVIAIGARSFSCCSTLVELSIPSGLVGIGEDAFNRCSSLTTLSIPDGVATIGECAFQGCSALVALQLPASLTAIENSLFDGCASLKTMSLPDGITSIGQLAFSCCSSLKHLALPLSVRTIGPGAFQYCPSLFALTFKGANVGETADGEKEEQLQAQLRRYLSGPLPFYVIAKLPTPVRAVVQA